MSDMIERVARVLYEDDPFYETGEAIDGFQVTPGGDMAWKQALDLAAEFGGEYEAALDEYRARARAALLAALETTCDETFEAVQSAVAFALQEDVDDQPLAVARAVFGTLRALADDGSKQAPDGV